MLWLLYKYSLVAVWIFSSDNDIITCLRQLKFIQLHFGRYLTDFCSPLTRCERVLAAEPFSLSGPRLCQQTEDSHTCHIAYSRFRHLLKSSICLKVCSRNTLTYLYTYLFGRSTTVTAAKELDSLMASISELDVQVVLSAYLLSCLT